MEYIDGLSLQFLRETKSVPRLDDKLELLAQAAEGLAAVHAAGFIHHDINPRNFLVDRDQRVKLIDFGLTVPNTPVFCRPGNRTGTLNYMAPELVRREPIDERIDIFAFGVVAFEFLTDKLPYDSTSSMASMLGRINHEPLDPIKANPNLPAPVLDLLRKLTAPEGSSLALDGHCGRCVSVNRPESGLRRDGKVVSSAQDRWSSRSLNPRAATPTPVTAPTASASASRTSGSRTICGSPCASSVPAASAIAAVSTRTALERIGERAARVHRSPKPANIVKWIALSRWGIFRGDSVDLVLIHDSGVSALIHAFGIRQRASKSAVAAQARNVRRSIRASILFEEFPCRPGPGNRSERSTARRFTIPGNPLAGPIESSRGQRLVIEASGTYDGDLLNAVIEGEGVQHAITTTKPLPRLAAGHPARDGRDRRLRRARAGPSPAAPRRNRGPRYHGRRPIARP